MTCGTKGIYYYIYEDVLLIDKKAQKQGMVQVMLTLSQNII